MKRRRSWEMSRRNDWVRKRALGILVALLAIGAMTPAEEAFAGNVRGQIVRQTSQGTVPAQGIAVSVYRNDIGRSGFAYTGYDGMYYLYSIPPGDYQLEVWLDQNTRLFYQIRVYNV